MDLPGTTRTYYDDPSLSSCDAKLLELRDGGRELVLDRSIFYPGGGGQPCDLGTIGGIPLEACGEVGGSIVHRLALPLDARAGDRVGLVLDRARRRDHSTQHSAQHLLSGLLHLQGITTRSFHLGELASTIDLDLPPDRLGADFVPRLEAEADARIDARCPFRIHVCPPESLGAMRLRKQPPADAAIVRIVEIVGLDHSPCGGTHVADAGELRLVRVLSVERYKGGSRLAFVAAARALAAIEGCWTGARAACRLLSSRPETLADDCGRLMARREEEGRRGRRLLEELCGLRIELSAAAGLPVLLRVDGFGGEGVELGCKALSKKEMAGAVLDVPGALVAIRLEGSGAPSLPSLEVMASQAAAGAARYGAGRGLFRASFAGSGDQDTAPERALAFATAVLGLASSAATPAPSGSLAG